MVVVANKQYFNVIPPSGGELWVTLAGRPTDIRIGDDARMRAQDAHNYKLRLAGPNGQFGDRDDIVLKIRSRTYNAVSGTVTLTLQQLARANQALRLTIVGTRTPRAPAVADTLGNLLDGDRDGIAGGNFVTVFAPRP